MFIYKFDGFGSSSECSEVSGEILSNPTHKPELMEAFEEFKKIKKEK